jgi:chemotaxis signal transduction protein
MSARRIDWPEVKRKLAQAERGLAAVLADDEQRKQQVLRSRAQYLAARRRETAPARALEPVLVFLLGDERYAVGLREVSQVLPLAGLVPVPAAPAGLLGVMNLRGEVGTVWDFAALLELRQAQAQEAPQGHVIVARAEAEIGLRVDFLEGCRDVDAAPAIAPHELQGALQVRFVKALARDGVRILDLGAVLGSIQRDDAVPDIGFEDG